MYLLKLCALLAVELAQGHEIDRDGALNGAARDHAAMGAGRRHMNEPALRERALGPSLRLLLVFFRKDFQSRVIERWIILRRSMQLIDIPRANDRLNQPGELGLRVARIPHAENKRGRRKLRQRRRVAGVEKHLERVLRVVLQLGRANYGVAEPVTSFQYRGDLLVPVSNVDLRNELRQWIFVLSRLRGSENRLHAIGLGANTIDCGNLRAVRQRVDVVTDIGISRRKDHAALAFDRREFLLEAKRDRAFQVIGPGIDLIGSNGNRFCHGAGSSWASIMQRAWPSWPGQPRRI